MSKSVDPYKTLFKILLNMGIIHEKGIDWFITNHPESYNRVKKTQAFKDLEKNLKEPSPAKD